MKNINLSAPNRYDSSKIFGIFCLTLAMQIPSHALAEAMHGVFMVVKGEVTLKSKKPIVKVKVGDKVLPGDIVETSIDSRAKIVMSDRNVINISPETTLEIQKYENNGEEKKVEMNLLQGKVRNNVEQKYDGEKNTFTVKTPTAVAGVRGTQFFTSFDPGTKITSVVTLRGAVSLAPINVNNGNVKPVIINKGEGTSVAPGANPETPKPMPKEELKKIDQESTVSAAPSKQDAPIETAAAEKKEEKKEEKKSEEQKSEAKANEPSGNQNSENSQANNQSDSSPSADSAPNDKPADKPANESASSKSSEQKEGGNKTAQNNESGAQQGSANKGPAEADTKAGKPNERTPASSTEPTANSNSPGQPQASTNNVKSESPVNASAANNTPQPSGNTTAATTAPAPGPAPAPAPTSPAPNSTGTASLTSAPSSPAPKMAQPVQPVAAPAAFKMIEIGDVDVGQINKILPPATVVNQPKPPPPVLINAPVVTKPPTTVINDIIRGTNGKARIIVNPVKK